MESEKRKVKAIIERANDGTYSIYMDADDMNYLVTGTGETAEEAIKTFLAGYEDTKRYYEDKGDNFEEAEFEFVYDMASFLSYFSKAFSLAGLSRITGINKGQLSHYMTGRRNPSRSTVEKIQESVKSFANDLSQVHFI
ncbi:helix-turn-helix transcriptional regulator [uncultured Parabacteroides sp.]|uniref:helix-turn-helix domain-containing protein n=1 Tax=uncultured Parabacteroides sp. TaxID=512312 RepID=UPI00261F9F77|nr:helix-turn-helix transcriptional regulator [uncultured Parabacteroides sp.]